MKFEPYKGSKGVKNTGCHKPEGGGWERFLYNKKNTPKADRI